MLTIFWNWNLFGYIKSRTHVTEMPITCFRLYKQPHSSVDLFSSFLLKINVISNIIVYCLCLCPHRPTQLWEPCPYARPSNMLANGLQSCLRVRDPSQPLFHPGCPGNVSKVPMGEVMLLAFGFVVRRHGSLSPTLCQASDVSLLNRVLTMSYVMFYPGSLDGTWKRGG